MMAQYTRIKQLHKDAILFFRLGDFYEMFHQDAREASAILGLTLTRRNGVPMAGLPYHSSQGYIEKLLKSGKKVAVCEQVRMPRDGKGIADREVVEIITPGTVVDEDFLPRGENNYLLSLSASAGGLSIAAVDLSTGDFSATWVPPGDRLEGLKREMSRISPREILVQESLLNEDGEISRIVTGRKDLAVNALPDWSFDGQDSFRRLTRLLGVGGLKGFGCEADDPALLSVGALIEYLEDNAKNLLVHIRDFKKYSDRDFLVLDESTLRNLELVRNLQDGSGKFTLMEVLDHTRTAMGARLLRRWILEPLVDPEMIIARQELVEKLYRDQGSLSRLRSRLAEVLDLERLAARVALDKAMAKDLLAVRQTLREGAAVSEIAGALTGGTLSAEAGHREELAALEELLGRALHESPPPGLGEGNLIREGYDGKLDELRNLQANRKEVLDRYLEEERAASGIPSLRIRYNKIIGYFLEVTRSFASSAPPHFIRRQSLVGGERYTTERLIELETLLTSASESIVELEKELFLDVRARVKAAMPGLLSMAAFLARTDALQSLAQAATVHGFVRPRIDSGGVLVVAEGRHPVVEMHLPPGEFIPNSLELDQEGVSFALITGPNMAGKSTYLRQTAHIVILAQMGSFVPAREARIGVVDRIFCRVGAQDNLARGESTFLVEMNETANILRNATEKSLVVMDEVGRGTGTNDGLAIARAVCEHLLARVRCKTLFATHYHELTVLEHPRLANHSMAVAEEGGDIVFLKKVVDGPSSNSYGIHVAKLAGLPDEVLLRAVRIFEDLTEHRESGPSRAGLPKKAEVQGSLFSSREVLEKEILAYPVEKTTPLEALNFIARWRKILLSEKKKS